MRTTATWIALLCIFVATLPAEERQTPMTLKKLTVNLYADEIEPCIHFWERLGFVKTQEVPAGNKLAFAILKKGDIELMYGTYTSLNADPEIAKTLRKGTTYLYVEVANLDEAIAAASGAPVVKPVHTTFYGATEVSVTEPAGNIVTFAQFAR
jgi:uncharacterized glyoxalase superfamily protein PhnB